MKTPNKLLTLLVLVVVFAAGASFAGPIARATQLAPLSSTERETVVAQLRSRAEFYIRWGDWYAYGPTDAAYYRGLALGSALAADIVLSLADREAIVAQLRSRAEFYTQWGGWYAYGPTDAAYYRGLAMGSALAADLVESYPPSQTSPAR